MAIAFSGLMHVSYFIQKVVGWAAGKPIQSNEPPKSAAQAAFVVLAFSLAVTLEGLFTGNTTMWDSVPIAVA
eukprot:4842286-Ditylum_brightwellii.AAC.1